MSKERELIYTINKHMPRSSNQLNKLFESDSEIIDLGGKKIAFSTDEFSEEDMLRDNDPYILGYNMTAGCISDILASGGIPKYYAHSFVAKNTWSKKYIEKLSVGISDVLKEVGVSFIGGDFGTSETWRYTGSVIGELEGEPLLRRGAKFGDTIFITGKVGRGNIDAALKLYAENPVLKGITKQFKTKFPLRKKEANLIKKYANCCIDTSDGVFNALNLISDINRTGFEVSNLVYEKSGALLSKVLNLPIELLFLGECGEYELLFTVSDDKVKDFLDHANEMHLEFYKIGIVKDKNMKILKGKHANLYLDSYQFSARDYNNMKDYLKDIVAFVRRE